MADKTKIEWTDATWNPLRGCTRVSEGCRNCYAEGVAARFSGPGQPYEGLAKRTSKGPRWTGKVDLVPSVLEQPLRWTRPRMVFVNSMSDLFHECVPDEWIDQIFAVMALCPQHTFQILTKRPERMRDYFACGPWDNINAEAGIRMAWDAMPQMDDCFLPNVWLGVSVEDQASADARVPLLLDAPAAVRFISAEPLLGPVDLTHVGEWVDWFDDCGGHPDPYWPADAGDARWLDVLAGCFRAEARGRDGARLGSIDVGLLHTGGRIDWVIVGGESGPNARPMHPDWARTLRDQCGAAKVPFFFKQWGAYDLSYDRDRDDPDWPQCDRLERQPGRWINLAGGHGFHGDRVHYARKVGKREAGRTLDGVTHDGMPGGRS